jgi:asparagine synthase (glutamine-hydrolysing)
MAHGLEARVPFLDLDFVRLVLRVPASRKMVTPGRMAKHVLRAAFDGWLPPDLLWRQKAQFHEGSGATDVLSAHLERSLQDHEFARLRTKTIPPLRTKEEAVYFRDFSQALRGIRPELTIERSVTT